MLVTYKNHGARIEQIEDYADDWEVGERIQIVVPCAKYGTKLVWDTIIKIEDGA